MSKFQKVFEFLLVRHFFIVTAMVSGLFAYWPGVVVGILLAFYDKLDQIAESLKVE